MERKIGETFDFGGVMLEVVEEVEFACEGCYFGVNTSLCSFVDRDVIGPCREYTRSDFQNVIFKKVKTRKAVREANAGY